MNASKENAKLAIDKLWEHGTQTGCLPSNSKTLSFVEEFLKAAERKLPSEAAYTKSKEKK